MFDFMEEAIIQKAIWIRNNSAGYDIKINRGDYNYQFLISLERPGELIGVKILTKKNDYYGTVPVNEHLFKNYDV